MRSAASRPITPALTPNMIVSMSSRRDSASACALTSASCCASRSFVIRLKARDNTAISSGSDHGSTRTERSPAATRPAACTSRATGAAMLPAADIASETAASSTQSTVSR